MATPATEAATTISAVNAVLLVLEELDWGNGTGVPVSVASTDSVFVMVGFAWMLSGAAILTFSVSEGAGGVVGAVVDVEVDV